MTDNASQFASKEITKLASYRQFQNITSSPLWDCAIIVWIGVRETRGGGTMLTHSLREWGVTCKFLLKEGGSI